MGVKSLGWEKRTAHPSPIHSWKLMVPCEVSAVKFGASSLIRSMVDSPLVSRCQNPDCYALLRDCTPLLVRGNSAAMRPGDRDKASWKRAAGESTRAHSA